MKKTFTLLFFAILGLNNINGATFVSISNGFWNSSSTWTITSGTDSDNVPDSDDDVTMASPFTVTLQAVSNAFKTLTFNIGGVIQTNGNVMDAYGDITIPGSGCGFNNPAPFRFRANCIFNCPGYTFTNNGTWSVLGGNLTLAVGTNCSRADNIVISDGRTVTNNGSYTFTAGKQLITYNTGIWVNAANSTLNMVANFSGSGSLVANATGNTVNYNTIGVTSVKNSTYYNLTINSTSSKTVQPAGTLTVLNDFSYTAGALNLNNNNMVVGGNWSNTANITITNQGSITFNPSGTKTISRSTSNEVFTNMIVNGAGTVQLNRSLTNGNLTITTGTLDISASNFTVNLTGNLTNNGGINCRQGLFNFNGSSAQTISGSQGVSFNDLTTSNSAGVSVLSTVYVFNLLRVNSGSFGTADAGIITIPASGPTTYGRIATVGGSLTGTGWVVESYIDGPADAGWQWLSSPINGNILADWDNDPRFYMSGVGGNDGDAGTFKSVRKYDEPTGTYINITTTSEPLTAGKGIMVWMADNSTGLTAPLIYNSVGTPNFGTINFPITAGGAGNGYNLVGNPFACPITYSAVVAASGNLYSSFIILLEDNTYATDPNGGIIAPNQGFMCVATTGGNIVFPESAKNIITSPNILRTAAQENTVTFTVYNNINGIGGRTYINFSDNSTDNFENGTDLAFIPSPSEELDNIYTKSMDQFSLLRNTLPNTGEEKSVPLTVKSGVFGSHFISAKGLSDLTLYNSVWLEDLTTGKKVDLLKNAEYEFNAEEIGKDYEFIIHFSNKKQLAGNENSVNTNTLNESTSVYNTPSNVVVKFSMDESTPVTISVYNLAGQKVMENINANVTDDRIALPLQKENGLYLLLIQSGNEQITRKIIY